MPTAEIAKSEKSKSVKSPDMVTSKKEVDVKEVVKSAGKEKDAFKEPIKATTGLPEVVVPPSPPIKPGKVETEKLAELKKISEKQVEKAKDKRDKQTEAAASLALLALAAVPATVAAATTSKSPPFVTHTAVNL